MVGPPPASWAVPPERARAFELAPGIWQLRLPLPWPQVPHVNAYWLADLRVLVDCGSAGHPSHRASLSAALGVAGASVDDVRTLVGTHTHSDHVGLAAWVIQASGCEFLMHPDTPIWLFLLPSAVLGFANAGIWAPLSSTVTRNLPPRQAGAGSGVYNTTRQIGAVLGSSAIAVLIQARLAAELPAPPGGSGEAGPVSFAGALPDALHEGFSTAMGQSILLPAAVILLGAAAALFFAKPKPVQGWGTPGVLPATSANVESRSR